MGSKPYIIGISGGSGSGKTTFIRKLRDKFGDEELCFISQDNYYKLREEQEIDAQGIRNFDLPTSFEMKDFHNDLLTLASGASINRQEYTYNNEKANSENLVVKSAPVIIVEGLFIFQQEEICDLLDLKILIQANDLKKVIRRIKRDQKERNYPIEDVLYRYEHHVLPSYEKYIQPYFPIVDIVINNNDSFLNGLSVLTGFLRNKIQNG